MNENKNGLDTDFWGISIVSCCIMLNIIMSSWKNTREYSYLGLATFMIFFISNAFDNTNIKINFDKSNYKPFGMRILPVCFFILTCLIIYSHDTSNYSLLSEVVDKNGENNNETREEKTIDDSSGYLAYKVGLIDGLMLVLFLLIIGSIYLDNSHNQIFYDYKSYIQLILIGGSISMFFCTWLISLPTLNKIINEDSTGD